MNSSEFDPLVLQPIGIIHSPFKEQKGAPIQGCFAGKEQGVVEVYEDYAAGLKDIEGFDYLFLLFGFHCSQGYRLEVQPYMDTVLRGLFTTRAPRRPNPLGLSIVRLVERKGPRLTIEEFDILNGSPLYDIKPYSPFFDGGREGCRIGWMQGRIDPEQSPIADNRFEKNQ